MAAEFSAGKNIGKLLERHAELSANVERAKNQVTDPNDFTNYRDLAEYREVNGGVTIDAAYHFSKVNDAAITADYEAALARNASRDAGALAKTEELGTIWGDTKNSAARLAVGANRAVGFGASLPGTISGTINAARASDEATDLFNREIEQNNERRRLDDNYMRVLDLQKSGSLNDTEARTYLEEIDRAEKAIKPLTAEELSILDTRPESLNKRSGGQGLTERERIQASRDDFANAAAWSHAFRESPVNDLANENANLKLDSDLSDSYAKVSHHFDAAASAFDKGDYATGVLETIGGAFNSIEDGVLLDAAANVVDNPVATFGYIVENIPQLAVGAYSRTALAAVNVAYGADIFAQAIERYQKENGGAGPSKGDMAWMALAAASASAFEQVADVQLLKAFDWLGAPSKAAGKAVASAATGVTNSGAKRVLTAIANNGLVKGVGNTAKTVATEGVTEIYQTAVEENLSTLETDFEGENLFKAGVLGAAAGGGITAVGELVGSEAEALKEIPAEAREALARQANRAKKYKSARETGEVANLIDPSNEEYDPDLAVAVIAEKRDNPETSEEEKATLTKQISDIDATVESRHAAVKEELKTLGKTDVSSLPEPEQEKHHSKIAKLFKEMDAIERQRTEIANIQGDSAVAQSPEPDAVDALIKQAVEPEATPATSEAAYKVIQFMMEIPESISPEQVEAFLDSDNLTPEQYDFVEKFSKAHAARNAAQDRKKVRKDILFGRPGFKGLQQYTANMAAALKIGDIARAAKELTGLGEFKTSHTNKIAAITEAQGLATDSAPAYAIQDPRTDSGWVVTDTAPTGFDPKNPGGSFVVAAGEKGQRQSVNVLEDMQWELDAIATTEAQLVSANALAQSTKAAAPTPGNGAQTSSVATETNTNGDTQVVAPVQLTASGVKTLPVTDEKRGVVTSPDADLTKVQKYTNASTGTLEVPRGPQITVESIDLKNSGLENTGSGDSDIVWAKLVEQRGRNSDGQLVGTVVVRDSEGNQYTAEVKFTDNIQPVVTTDDKPQRTATAKKAEDKATTPPAKPKAAPVAANPTATTAEPTTPLPATAKAAGTASEPDADSEWTKEDILEIMREPALFIETAEELAAEGRNDVGEAFEAAGEMAARLLEGKSWQEVRAQLMKVWGDPDAMFPGGASIAIEALENQYGITEAELEALFPTITESSDTNQKEEAEQAQVGEEAAATEEEVSPLEAEINDAGLILDLLGLEGTADQNVSTGGVIATMLATLTALKSDNVKEAMAAIQNTLNWLANKEMPRDDAYEARKSRAIHKDAAKQKKRDDLVGGRDQHLLGQLIEELNEVLAELVVNENPDKAAEINSLLALQKSALKVLRFGPETVVKDKAGNKTNAEILTEQLVAAGYSIEQASDVQQVYALIEELTSDIANLFDGVTPNTQEAVTEEEVFESGAFTFAEDPDNRLATNFEQSQSNKNSKTRNPLVEVKDFMSQLFRGGMFQENLASRFLKGDVELTAEIIAALEVFQRYAQDGVGIITKNIQLPIPKGKQDRAANDKYIHRNYLRYFNNDIPANLTTAISAATFSWLGENGDSLQNSYRDIHGIYGVDTKTRLTGAHYDLVRFAGTRQGVVVREIGQRAFASLSWRAKKNMPANEQARLELALGIQGLYQLMDMGLVERHVIKSSALVPVPFNPDTPFTEVNAVETDAMNAEVVNELIQKWEVDEQAKIDTWIANEEKKGRTSEQMAAFRLAREEQFKVNRQKEFTRLNRDLHKEVHPFIRLIPSKSDPSVPTPAITEMVIANRASGGVIGKLFRIDAAERPPSSKPGQYSQPGISNSSMSVPGIFDAVGKAVSSYKQGFRKDLQKARAAFSFENVAAMAGVVNLEEGSPGSKSIHVSRHAGIAAKNEGIIKGIKRLMEFESTFKGDHFFLAPLMWSIQRVGQASNVINTQTDKFQRHNITMRDHQHVIDPSLVDENGNTTDPAMKGFLLAIAQNMGLFDDGTYHADTLTKLQEKMETDEAKAALAAWAEIESLRPDENGNPAKLDEDLQTAVVQFVNSLGQDFAGADALNGYHMFLKAKANNNEKFISEMFFEIDGIANGPTLANIFAGTMKWASGKKSGFFNKKDGYESYADFRKNVGNMDMYQTMAARINGLMQNSINSADGNKPLSYLLEINGQLIEEGVLSKAARLTAKESMTPIMFGSRIKKTIENMSVQFEDRYIAALEKAVREGDEAQIAHLFDTVGRLTRTTIVRDNSMSLTEQAMTVPLTYTQSKELHAAYRRIAGEFIEKATIEELGDFITRRDILNNASNVAWERYNGMYELLRSKTIAAKIASGEIDRLAPRDLTQEETAKIEEELKGFNPVVHTYMSILSDDLSAGLNVGKLANIPVSPKDADYAEAYRQTVPKGSGKLDSGDPTRGKANRLIASLTNHGKRRVLQAPGPRTVVVMTHAIDSAIAMRVYEKMAALHVHDAEGVGVNNIEEAARIFNEATFEVLSEYSLAREISNMLERSFAAEEALLPGHAYETEMREVLLKIKTPEMRPKEDTKTVPKVPANRTYLAMFTAEALRIEIDKLNFLGQVEIVNQYSYEGGHYAVNDEQRSTMKARAKELQDVHNMLVARIATASTPASATASNDSAYGYNGEAYTKADEPEIVKLLDAETGTREILSGLRGILTQGSKAGSRIKRFQLSLLDALMPTINQDKLSITVWRDVTDPEASAYGRYRPNYTTNEDTIHIRGAMFAKSAVSAEVLLHELTHAGSVRMVGKYQGYEKPLERWSQAERNSWEAVQQLKMLQKDVAQYLKDNQGRLANIGLGGHFQPAASLLEELITYGLTNVNFQNEVLAKIEIRREEKLNARYKRFNGLERFRQTLAQIFFGTRMSEETMNGMDIMLAQSMSLFAEQATITQAQQEAALAPDGSQQSGQQDLFNDDVPGPATYTSLQVFEGLGEIDTTKSPLPSAVTQRLRNLLVDVTNAIYGQAGALRPTAERTAPTTAEEVYLDAKDRKELPFVTKLEPLLSMTHQEGFVAQSLELAINKVLRDKNYLDAGTASRRKELTSLWNQAKAAIKPRDLYVGPGTWETANADERQEANDAHRIIFTATRNEDGSSDYLAQFAAAAMAYQPLYSALDKLRTPADPSFVGAKTMAQKVKVVITKIMNKISRAISGAQTNERLSVSVTNLARNMAALEAKKKRALVRTTAMEDSWLSSKAHAGAESVRKSIYSVASSDKFSNNKNKVVSLFGKVTATVAGERSDQVLAVLSRVTHGGENERNNLLGSIINEMRNGRDMLKPFNDMLSLGSKHEKTRMDTILRVTEFIDKSFSKKLTKAESEAGTRTWIRTDMSSLLGKYTLAQLTEMTANPAALEAEIKVLEAEFTDPDTREYYLGSTVGLGFYMARGRVAVDNLMFNAHNIAYLRGTDKMINGTNAKAERAVKTIDPLASLYALRWTSATAKKTAAQIMKRENARRAESDGIDEGNGLEVVLRQHKGMQKMSREKLFGDGWVHVVKGYAKDSYDSHVTLLAADSVEGAELRQAGYQVVSDEELGQDSADQDPPRKLYYVKYGGMKGFVVGFLPNTGKRAKGSTTKGDPQGGALTLGKRAKNDAIRKAKQAKVRAMFTMGESFDPTKVTDTLLAPVLNDKGYAADYRYLMSENTKDTVQNRENRLGNVLGSTAGSIYGKSVTPGVSEQGIDLLRAHYDMEYAKDRGSFIEFSENSTDPKVVERYKLLPDETKRYIRKKWGRAGMKVHRDTYDIAFGYRKYSVAEAFDKEPDVRNIAEKTLVATLTHLPVVRDGRVTTLGPAAALRVAQAEDVWQELVKVGKDIMVIKNFWTLAGNESSNSTVLWMKGVPLEDIAKDKVIGIQSTFAYLKDTKERDNLQMQIDNEHVSGRNKSAAEQRIIELDDAMKQNPIRVLVDAGFFQTLIEDIETDKDPFSYKSRAEQWISDKTANVPTAVKDVTKFMLMTHDTTLYKVLNSATVYSDFTSRYVLYKHLTTRKNNPLDHDAALHEARQTFVNYDVPTHKGLQYANDNGFIWFTKYYLRMQAVIFQMARDNPARALALAASAGVIDIPDVMESSFLNKAPVNFGSGAMELPWLVDDMATMQVALAPF